MPKKYMAKLPPLPTRFLTTRWVRCLRQKKPEEADHFPPHPGVVGQGSEGKALKSPCRLFLGSQKPSLKLTASLHLKMDFLEYDRFPFGARPIFGGRLLVSGSVIGGIGDI